VEQFAPPLAVACPAHGGPDHVRRVSAVSAGASAVTGPARLLLSANRLAWAGTACGVLGAVLLSIRAVAGGSAAGSVALLVAACVCFGYAIACSGLANARRVGAFLVRRPPREEEHAVWYCERCNAVFTEKAG